MKEVLVCGKSLPEAYHKALSALHTQGEISDCADWNTTQKELSMTMAVTEPLSEPGISKLFIGGFAELQQYLMEMLDGILDFEIARGNWAYTYHDRMVNLHGKDQVAFIADELRRSPSSRRAVVIVRDVDADMGSDDPACLQHLQFFIRKGKLDCDVLFRSNDACKATFMNAFALIRLQKRIADELGIEVGTYTHRANSFHCYQKDFGMLAGYVNRIDSEDFEDLCYEYEDDWKDLMEDCIPEIEEKVAKLKGE